MFVIDYTNGSMGNTFLSHILYSCNQVDFDLLKFFSKSGNAHKISKLITQQNYDNRLLARHLSRRPLNKFEKCLITIVPDDEVKPLIFKMSYEKWYRAVPTENTINKFFLIDTADNTNTKKLERLTLNYFNMMRETWVNQSLDSETIMLSEYLKNGISDRIIKLINEKLGWAWDYNKDYNFYKSMLLNNQQYFDWLKQINEVVEYTVNYKNYKCNLMFWEKALVIALACFYAKIHPQQLRWYDYDNMILDDNTNLIENLKEFNHGKTF